MQVSLHHSKILISPRRAVTAEAGRHLYSLGECRQRRAGNFAHPECGRGLCTATARGLHTPPRIDLGDDEQPRRLVPQQMAWIAPLEAISLASGLAVAITLGRRGKE